MGRDVPALNLLIMWRSGNRRRKVRGEEPARAGLGLTIRTLRRCADRCTTGDPHARFRPAVMQVISGISNPISTRGHS